MHLLFTITAYPPSTGGAQLHTHLLAQTLLKRHSLSVVAWWDNNRTDWLLGTTLFAPQCSQGYEIDGISVYRLGLNWQEKVRVIPCVLLYYPMMHYALPRISAIQREKLRPYVDEVDLIHNIRVGREGLSYASWQLARQRGVPFIFTPLHHPRWVGWRYKAYLELYKQADAVIALTAVEKRVLISLGVDEEKIHVTGIGPVLAGDANPERFLAAYKIEAPFILFLGQHYAYKGFKQLLEAAPLVWKQIPETVFVFVGPPVGDSEKYFEANSDTRIQRLGAVDLQEKSDALAACSILCVPSTQESFGGVYTEAWSFGKPVIGCNIPAVAEVISDGVNGYLVEQNSEEIAARIIELLRHPLTAERLGQQGNQKVVERYSWEQLAAQTELIYHRTLAG